MGKYLIGVFFVLIAIILVLNLRADTIPEVEKVGENINDEIQEVYVDPTP